MTTVTQTIATYNSGISQQADELKLPGQVTAAKNVFPDVTFGLTKRPGAKLVKSLSDDSTSSNNSDTNGKWFSYYRDESEQYIGQINDNGVVRMWNCSTGNPVTVTYTSEADTKAYLAHLNPDDVQCLTINDFTFVSNRSEKKDASNTHDRTTVEMSAESDDIAAAAVNEAYVELKKISYASQYALNIYDSTTTTEDIWTATRLTVFRAFDSANGCDSSGNFPSGGTLPTGGNYCTAANAGNNQDAYCPNVGTKVFEVSHGDGISASSDSNQTAYTISVTVGEGSASDKKNLYFRLTTIGQSVPQGGSATNPDYRCRYTTTIDLLHGGEGWRVGDHFNVWMHNARYNVKVTKAAKSRCHANIKAVRPQPTPFDASTAINAESIIGEVRREIISNANFGENDVVQIGSGLYMKQTSGGQFSVTTPFPDLMNVLTDEVRSVEDLPTQCKHGYVVKVSNSVEEEDDWYVKFQGANDRDGPGVWEECPKPGRSLAFRKRTMPHKIVRQADGTFNVGPIDWDKCLVGDENTNPEPSFLGKKINKILFFRNRLVLFSDENVIMSRPGSYYDFWNKTAMTFSTQDPIDISCTSDKPAILYDGMQINTGLLMFTKNQQFLLTTDSDILSPQTAKINSISNYNFNANTNPVSLGSTVGWLDNAGMYSRFFEMQNALREGEPEILEQSKVVAKLFNDNLKIISSSPENGLVFFSEKGSVTNTGISTIYCYKYFDTDRRVQQAWFTWELPGTIQHHDVMDDSFYVVMRNGENDAAGRKDSLIRFDLKIQDEVPVTIDDFDTTDTSDDVTYNIHLDSWSHINIASDAYNATTNKTVVAKPTGYNSSSQLAVFKKDGTHIGRYEKVTVNGSNLEWTGNWASENNVVLGYLFDYEVKFPTIYRTKQTAEGRNVRADVNASLIIHRVRLNLGHNGLYETLLERKGKSDYTSVWEAPIANSYNANQLPFLTEVQQTIPVYERNTNLSLTLKSTHPSPTTLYSMSWEGDYSNKFYQRV